MELLELPDLLLAWTLLLFDVVRIAFTGTRSISGHAPITEISYSENKIDYGSTQIVIVAFF